MRGVVDLTREEMARKMWGLDGVKFRLALGAAAQAFCCCGFQFIRRRKTPTASQCLP